MSRLDVPVEILIQQLHNPDWTAGCDAARLLGPSGDPRAVDALLPDLNDPDWRVRRNPVQARVHCMINVRRNLCSHCSRIGQ